MGCVIIVIISTEAQIEIVDDEPLRAAIESLGGWPVVDQDWANVPGKTVPSVEVLLAVLKRKFSLGVIIEEWVGQDDKNSHNHIIQVRLNNCFKP